MVNFIFISYDGDDNKNKNSISRIFLSTKVLYWRRFSSEHKTHYIYEMRESIKKDDNSYSCEFWCWVNKTQAVCYVWVELKRKEKEEERWKKNESKWNWICSVHMLCCSLLHLHLMHAAKRDEIASCFTFARCSGCNAYKIILKMICNFSLTSTNHIWDGIKLWETSVILRKLRNSSKSFALLHCTHLSSSKKRAKSQILDNDLKLLEKNQKFGSSTSKLFFLGEFFHP